MATLNFPPRIHYELEGWQLIWFRLLPADGEAETLAGRMREEAGRARSRHPDGIPTGDEVVSEIRGLFRDGGIDPTRYRPSSEALLRRVLKGDEIPLIHPMVDLNNLLSLRLLVPCCVLDPDHVSPPFTLRLGAEGEEMDSLRGVFNLEGKPLLEDLEGPFGTPITDSERVRIRSDTGEVWLVAYLPRRSGDPERVEEELKSLLDRTGVARLAETAVPPLPE